MDDAIGSVAKGVSDIESDTTVVKTDERRKAIGDRVRLVRGRRGADVFAAALGVSAKTLWLTEVGKRFPGGDEILALRDRFSVDPRWLLVGEGQAPPITVDDTAPSAPATDHEG